MENFSLQKIFFSGQRISAGLPEKMLDLTENLQVPYILLETFLGVRDLWPIQVNVMKLAEEFIT